MIDRRSLLRALARRDIADWVLVRRDREIGIADDAGLRRSERGIRWSLVVHHDAPGGRGSAHVAVDAVDADANAVVEQAVAQAIASVGPGWVSRPLAAPARVELADPALVSREPLVAASDAIRKLVRPSGAQVAARAMVVRERVDVAARGGLRTDWRATSIEIEALIAAGERSLALARAERRLDALGFDRALASAADDLAQLATAGKPTPGPCSVVFGTEAMLHGGLGVWEVFVTQADAVIGRRGLARYRERAPIAPGADHLADPLTIASEGARDHGLLSAPLDDEGAAVRTFTLVDRGVAGQLGLSPREAALRRRDPNGGVRNLAVRPGASWTGAIDASAGRVIEVRRLRDLMIDRLGGLASLEIALAIDHPSRTVFEGGTIHLDLIDALARARRSTTEITRGAYRGPDTVLVGGAELVA